MNRREFLELLGALTTFAAGCGDMSTKKKQPDLDSRDLTSLGGAPDTHEGRTIAAFSDTIIPGAPRDASGAPGALEAGACAAFFNPQLPAAALVPLLVMVLDAFSNDRTFVGLRPSRREAALDEALAAVPQIAFAIQLVKVSYYASSEAGGFLGYPGPNWGYSEDDDFSFRAPMAEPHPKVITSGDGEGHYE